jgi:hypothetical protein
MTEKRDHSEDLGIDGGGPEAELEGVVYGLLLIL